MADDLLLLLAGFVLTTVAGGFLTYVFQRRSWDHQNEARHRESELAAATAAFDEISSLMDRRLYRMRQLNWRLARPDASPEEIEARMDAYREVLYAWNDAWNRNRALVQRYFGREVGRVFEFGICEEFKRIGALLEVAYAERRQAPAGAPGSLDSEIVALSDDVYELNSDIDRADPVRTRRCLQPGDAAPPGCNELIAPTVVGGSGACMAVR